MYSPDTRDLEVTLNRRMKLLVNADAALAVPPDLAITAPE